MEETKILYPNKLNRFKRRDPAPEEARLSLETLKEEQNYQQNENGRIKVIEIYKQLAKGGHIGTLERLTQLKEYGIPTNWKYAPALLNELKRIFASLNPKWIVKLKNKKSA